MKSDQKPKGLIRKIVGLVVLMALISLVVFVFFNRQYVIDKITVLQYSPSSEISAFADRTGMSSHGRFMYYAATPQLLNSEDFSKSCVNRNELSVILGCYSGGVIYIFNVDDARLDGVEEVTAAHEMLHAAYERMSDSERRAVNSLVEKTYDNLTIDDDLSSRLDIYEKTEPGQRNNELFAIFGTEFKDVDPELEFVYDRFFEDRSKVVALSNTYNDLFRSLRNQAEDIESRVYKIIDERNTMIEDYNDDYADLQNQIETYNASKSSMPIYQARNEAARLNDEVTALNERYDSTRGQVEILDKQIQRLEQQYEAVSMRQLELQSLLDSRLEPSVQQAG